MLKLGAGIRLGARDKSRTKNKVRDRVALGLWPAGWSHVYYNLYILPHEHNLDYTNISTPVHVLCVRIG